jgi:tetratricopeptide (TPR) repeat protein
MKTLRNASIVVAWLFCAATPSISFADNAVDDPAVLFRSGNAHYEQGDFEAAIDDYRSLIDAGVIDGDLYYNLANAYYKNDELGNAVLFYARALRIQPRNEDARDNLALVRAQLRDKQFVRSQNRLVRAVIWLHNNLTTREMLIFASCSYLVLCLLTIVYVFRRSGIVTAVYRRISLFSPGRLIGLSLGQDLLVAIAIAALLVVTSGVSAAKKLADTRSEAVVLTDEIGVFSGPTKDSILQFKIHEGTLVNVRTRRDEWVRIELPGGMSGWVLSSAVETV